MSFTDESEGVHLLEPPRCANNNVRCAILQHGLLGLKGKPAKEVAHFDGRQVHAEALKLVTNLHSRAIV